MMIRWMLFFIFLFLDLQSEEFQQKILQEKPRSVSHNPFIKEAAKEESAPYNGLSNFEGLPSAIVQGVNVMTGDYSEITQDIFIPSPQPINFTRSYTSSDSIGKQHKKGSLGYGWNMNHKSEIQFQSSSQNKLFCELNEGNGVLTLYEGKSKKKEGEYRLTISEDIIKQGLTNCGQGQISGRTNLKNTKIFHRSKNCRVVLGNGSTSFYQEQKKNTFDLIEKREANGNSLHYEYDLKTRRPTQVIAKNKEGKKLGGLLFEYNDEKKNLSKLSIKSTHSPIHVNYSFEKYEHGYFLTDVYPSHGPHVHYSYENGKHHYERICRKDWANGRFLEIDYYKKGKNKFLDMTIKVDGSCNVRHHRVMQLKSPVDVDETPIATHSFVYQFRNETESCGEEGGHTTVYDAIRNPTVYYYDENRRLKKIHYQNANKIDHIEKFYWGKDVDESLLISRILTDEHGNAILGRFLQYDAFGNITKEKLLGNLSGWNSTNLQIKKDGSLVRNGCETYKKTYQYSNDGLNLLLSEIDGGKTTTFGYQAGSDLLTHQFIYYDNRLQERHFYEYDANAALSKEIWDDGSSVDCHDLTNVTERHIRHIQNKRTAPIGLPKRIEEKYLDLASKQEILLQKIENEYSLEGRLIRQNYYDSEEKFSYALEWEYDLLGNVTKETNALGQSIIRTYNANGNLTSERGPRNLYTRHLIYDFANRLICSKDIHDDGKEYVTTHRYNHLNQRIATIDVCGHVTSFIYDRQGRLHQQIECPVMTEEGCYSPTQTISYDLLGNPTLKIDASGQQTKTLYTIYGKPYEIKHPNGTIEWFEYNLDGTLKKSTDQKGLITLFTYDSLKRLIKTDFYSPNMEHLSSTQSTYNAFHKTSDIDEENHVTHYVYDGAGRLVATLHPIGKTTYEFDSLGRLSVTKEWLNEHQYKVKFSIYNPLNQIIEERVEDEKGTLYSVNKSEYDADGNCIAQSKLTNGQELWTTTTYDAYKQPIQTIDFENHITRFVYNHHHINAFGQRVFEKILTDPSGKQIITILNTHGQIASITQKNAMGEIIAHQDISYDLLGRKKCVREKVFIENQSEKTILTKWDYDAKDNVIQLTEALGTPEQRITRYTYNGKGEKEHIIKSDGTLICHIYDCLGRLIHFYGSDDSFNYQYTYDKKSRPIEILDHLTKKISYRKYDVMGNLLSETLATGYTSQYEYDFFDRPIKTTLFDGSSVTYSYDAVYLRTMQRLDNHQNLKYEHHYNLYDESGNLLEATLPSKTNIHYVYDRLNRQINCTTHHWEEKIVYNNLGELIQQTITDSIGSINNDFTYTDLSQLKSESGNTNHSYLTDSLFNRLEKDQKAHTVNALNQLLHDGSVQYEYDTNGNLIQCGDKKFSYDALDRLIKIITPKSTSTYTYDAFNRRLSKNQDHYLYQGLNEIGLVNSEEEICQLRVLGTGKGAEIGAAVAIEINTIPYIPIHDHNGNVCNLLNLQGQFIETYRYSAFGEETVFDFKDKIKSLSLNPWRYASKRVDSETGYLYFGRRYYDPQNGKWITTDPLGFAAGPNLYAYVKNSPLDHFDLYGLYEISNNSRDFSFVAPIAKFSNRAFLRSSYEKQYDDPKVRYCPHFEKDHPNQSHEFSLPDFPLDAKMSLANGMNTPLKDAYANLSYVNKMSMGKNIIGVYNATHGSSRDMQECRMGLYDFIATDPVKVLHQQWDRFFAKYGKDAVWLQICHSQGAIHVRNALIAYDPEKRKHIRVLAVAPAAYIEKKYCMEALHLVSTRDFVPSFDYIGRERCRETTKLLRPHKNASLHDHAFTSPTYYSHIRDYLKEHIQKYGD